MLKSLNADQQDEYFCLKVYKKCVFNGFGAAGLFGCVKGAAWRHFMFNFFGCLGPSSQLGVRAKLLGMLKITRGPQALSTLRLSNVEIITHLLNNLWNRLYIYLLKKYRFFEDYNKLHRMCSGGLNCSFNQWSRDGDTQLTSVQQQFSVLSRKLAKAQRHGRCGRLGPKLAYGSHMVPCYHLYEEPQSGPCDNLWYLLQHIHKVSTGSSTLDVSKLETNSCLVVPKIKCTDLVIISLHTLCNMCKPPLFKAR